jgi:hypothetical protein
MGMFDYIVCEYPLPDGADPSKFEFQSKDLDCALDTYTISKDGKLIHDQNFDASPNEEAMDTTTKKLTEIPYHGYLRFYGGNISGLGPQGYITKNNEPPISREYRAKFTDGRVVNIELVSNKTGLENCKHITKEEFFKSW